MPTIRVAGSSYCSHDLFWWETSRSLYSSEFLCCAESCWEFSEGKNKYTNGFLALCQFPGLISHWISQFNNLIWESKSPSLIWWPRRETCWRGKFSLVWPDGQSQNEGLIPIYQTPKCSFQTMKEENDFFWTLWNLFQIVTAEMIEGLSVGRAEFG